MMEDTPIRKKGAKTTRVLGICLDDEHKEKYVQISKRTDRWMPEELRRVIYPAIDRIHREEFGDDQVTAG